MARLVASLFGTGLLLGRLRGSHVGSGTVGAMVAAAPVYLAGSAGGLVWQLGLAAFLLFAGLWSSSRLTDEHGDAGWIVIDEAAGTAIALLGLNSVYAAAVALLVFRGADIFKGLFPGVAAADRRQGAIGVMGDDIVAGLYGLLAGLLVQAAI